MILSSYMAVVRTTQILIEKGWKFIDNGYDDIEYAYHEDTGQKHYFANQVDFNSWLNEAYQNNNKIH
jgi:hypothetical protein